ncbi:hypothetical protein LJC26_04500 [Desulfovibrio sp. OttesenSCG-928-O18]|nr:hypothetical protein [Desulfovibrio sp. OttesenSCG-928-O18]
MEWKPSLDTSILDERMDNAMRRVSGSVGLDISFDKGRMRTLKETAGDALNAGLGTPGPLFMKVGKGAFEAGFLKIGESLDPKNVGAEILYEFHAESTGAFQAGKAALYAEARDFLQQQGVSEEHCNAVLAAAEGTFAVPDKDAFTKVGLPFVKAVATPFTQAVLGGIAGFLCVFLLTRVPHLGFFSGVLIGGAAYYLARSRVRKRCEQILQLLPRSLYDMLATEWNTNTRRYAETVNAGLAPAATDNG